MPSDDVSPESPEDEPPRGEMEHLIVLVWSEVLNADVTSRYDDFFLLGGSSLGVIRVSTELSELLGFAVRPRTVYEYTELADLAQRLTRLRADATATRP